MKQDYDVIVIGAGFGGPVAAKKCADAGLKTLMIERSQVPGDKVISGLGIPIYGFLFGPEFIRNGNPPIERPISAIVNRFIEKGEIYDTDRSLRLPNPIAVAYSAYSKPFCIWLADRALESGAELRTSTTVVDLIKENGVVKGVITDTGEALRSTIVIDSGGTQNTLAIKAGIRKKLPPAAVELYMIWDYEMPKSHVDRIFGNSSEFFHARPEERIGAPLGFGSTTYCFTYRDSIHPGLGQFLLTQGKVPNLKKLLKEYFHNFTSQVSRWKNEIAPYAKLRGIMWDICPIYAGLIPEVRSQPIHDSGIMIIGDAAGFEATAFGDGVPNAWFSADIAADVAIEAINAGNVSKDFLNRYQERIDSHPFIPYTISDPRRWNMRELLANNNKKEFKKRIVDHWGLGLFKYDILGRSFLKAFLQSAKSDLVVIPSWIKMFRRYYRNWETNSFDKPSARFDTKQATDNYKN